MANDIMTPENPLVLGHLSRLFLANYDNQAILPRLFDRSVETEFSGGRGMIVSIRTQASLEAKLFDPGVGIDPQPVNEGIVNVEVKNLFDVSVELDLADRNMRLSDWQRQVVEPAARALVDNAEKLVADHLGTGTQTASLDSTDPIKGLVGARKQLNNNRIPQTGRFIIAGSDAAEAMLQSDQLIKADQAGDQQALRQANIGRILGMPVYESIFADPKDVYVCQKDALTFVNIVPVVPPGAASGSVATANGIGIRVVYDYDAAKKIEYVSWDHWVEVTNLRGFKSWVKATLS